MTADADRDPRDADSDSPADHDPPDAGRDSGAGAVTPRRWHAALAYALLGPPARDMPEPPVPNAATLLDALGGAAAVRAAVLSARESGQWPHEVPAELGEGLGAAQLAAAWSSVVAALGPLTADARPVVVDRAPTTAERRLLADRPPHHAG